MVKKIGNLIKTKIKRVHKEHPTKIVYIETSSRCNLSCTYCYRQDYSYDSKNKDMDFDLFKKIIDEFSPGKSGLFSREKVTLFLHGYGEPTLNPMLAEMVAYAKRSGKFNLINFVSNLLAVDKNKYDEYFKAGLSKLHFSLDSLKEEHVTSTRVGTNFEKMIDSLKYLAGKYGDKLVMITVLSQDNKDDIAELSDFLVDVGIKNWTMQLLNRRDGTFDLADDEVDSLHKELVEKGSGLIPVFEKKELLKCTQPFDNLVINAMGYLTPCCSMTDSDRINFGNVSDENIYELYESDEFKRFREKFSRERPDVCKDCPYY